MSDLPPFDELVKLAQEDPKALEALRKQHVEQLINSAPEGTQTRLKGLQFQIDAHRAIHTDSPMGACMKISQMMHESFAELRGWLNQISNLNDPLREIASESAQQEGDKIANVLAFPSR